MHIEDEVFPLLKYSKEPEKIFESIIENDIIKLKALLYLGLNVNLKDDKGYTLLHRAVYFGRLKCSKI